MRAARLRDGRGGRTAWIPPEHVETNIVVLDLAPTSWSASALAAAAREQGVLISALGRDVRATHLDVDDEGLAHASSVLAGLLRT